MTATATASTTAGVHVRARYTGVAALGLVLMASAPLIFVVAGMAAGLPAEDTTFFAVVMVLLLVGAGLVWRFGTWAKALGVVLALLGAFAGFWITFGLAFPASFVDFVPGLLLPVGLVTAVGGGIAAMVAKRRGHVGTQAAVGERRITTTVLTIVALAAAVSAVLSFTSRSTADASAAAASAITRNFEFAEGTYAVAAGESIAIHNSDPIVHDFAVPELGIDPVNILPGSTALVEIGGAPGSYVIYCTLHSDTSDPAPDAADSMVATLVVE